MNYLDLVNNVLRRLRETEVTSVQSNAYSKLIGDLVNDAKNLVESSWDWSMQRKVINTTLNNPAEGNRFTLVGSGEAPKIQSMFVGWSQSVVAGPDLTKTATSLLTYIDQVSMQEYIRLEQPLIGNPTPTGTPIYYSLFGIDSNRDTIITLYPSPDPVALLLTSLFKAQADLVNDTDKLEIPVMPVLHLAVAFASRERGETGGTSTQEYFTMANKYLSDAIALDAANAPEKTIFYTP